MAEMKMVLKIKPVFSVTKTMINKTIKEVHFLEITIKAKTIEVAFLITTKKIMIIIKIIIKISDL